MINIESETIFNNNSNDLTPTIPQEEALFSISKMKQQNKNKYLIVLPSGMGKTYLSAFETYDFDGRILYVAHRNEILIQAKKVFKNIHKIDEKDIGIYKQEKKQLNKKIVFASIQTISREENLKEIPKDYFGYIILDEWHHVGASSYKRVLQHFKPKYLLGMTATPYRLDGKDILSPVNYNIPCQMELKEGIDSGWLVPFEYYGLWDDVDYSDIKWKGYKYTQKDLDKKLLINKRDKSVITEVKKRIGKRQTIGFCNSVKHVKRCVKKFNDAGFSTNAIHYEMDLDERRKIIDDFRDGKYQIIFTRDIFNEGVDFPEVECLLFLRPTFSKTVFFQQLGRGLRKREGKENVLVLDFIGNYTNAYKIREWFREIVVTTGEGESYFKPEFVHNIPLVIFDSAIIELFEAQTPLSNEKIIEDFYKLKKELGKTPLFNDFVFNNPKRRYCIESRWISCKKFLRYLNEIPYYGSKTLDEIKQEINKAKKILGKVPTTDECIELCKRGLLKFNIVSACYTQGTTYGKLLYEMGEKPNEWNFIDLDIIKKIYNEIKKDKKRIPIISDFPFTVHIFRNKLGFKHYHDFVRYMNDEPRTHLGVTKEEFMSDIKRIWKKIGHQPTMQEYKKLGKFSVGSAWKKWGKWTEMMNSIGGKNLMGRIYFSQKELEREYVRIRNSIGEPLSISKFRELNKLCLSTGPYKRIWKKWTLAKEYLEKKYFDKHFHQKVTKQDCIDAYIKERKKLKEPVPISHIKNISYYNYVTRFGNLTKAKEECEEEYLRLLQKE